jgi:hypothetical protein
MARESSKPGERLVKLAAKLELVIKLMTGLVLFDNRQKPGFSPIISRKCLVR